MATNVSAMFLLLPMVGMTKMADEGVQLGKERFAGELEMMAHMDQERKRAPWIGKPGGLCEAGSNEPSCIR